MSQDRAQLRTDLCDALETLIGSLSAGGHSHWVEWLQSAYSVCKRATIPMLSDTYCRRSAAWAA